MWYTCKHSQWNIWLGRICLFRYAKDLLFIMHWEQLEENSGVFYSDMLDEYFIADYTSAAPEEVQRIIRAHKLLQPNDVEEDEDDCSLLWQHEDTFAGNHVTCSVFFTVIFWTSVLLLLLLVQSTGHEEVNKIIHLPRCCVPLSLWKRPTPVLVILFITYSYWSIQSFPSNIFFFFTGHTVYTFYYEVVLEELMTSLSLEPAPYFPGFFSSSFNAEQNVQSSHAS